MGDYGGRNSSVSFKYPKTSNHNKSQIKKLRYTGPNEIYTKPIYPSKIPFYTASYTQGHCDGPNVSPGATTDFTAVCAKSIVRIAPLLPHQLIWSASVR